MVLASRQKISIAMKYAVLEMAMLQLLFIIFKSRILQNTLKRGVNGCRGTDFCEVMSQVKVEVPCHQTGI